MLLAGSLKLDSLLYCCAVPTISAITPTSAFTSGGGLLTITGTYLGSTATGGTATVRANHFKHCLAVLFRFLLYRALCVRACVCDGFFRCACVRACMPAIGLSRQMPLPVPACACID